MKKMLYATILMAVLSSLFISGASAVSISVFAPLNYAGVAPSFPTPFGVWGAWA
jgi:hypothetical protein